MRSTGGPTFGATRAEVVLGFRLAARHVPARTAAAWAAGLAVVARVAGGTLPADRLSAAVVALGGLMAAAAGSRLLVRGGPRESLRWTHLPGPVAALARVVGAVGFTGAAAAVVTAILAEGRLPLGTVAAAAGHALIIAALAAALAPRLGCATAAAFLTLLVAAGVASDAYPRGAGIPGWAGALTPPGILLARTAVGGGGPDLQLACWVVLAAAGLVDAGRARVVRRAP